MKLSDLEFQFNKVGENVNAATTDDGVLLLAIDPKVILRSSSSGKSDTVATTGGNIFLCGVKVGVNVYRPLDKAEMFRRERATRQAAIDAEQAKRDAVAA